MACLTAATSSGEVLALTAIANAGAARAGGGGGAALDGRSGMVEGVNGGALRGTSAPPLLMTPDGGTEAVEVTGREGTDSNIGPGAAFAVAWAVGFAFLSDLRADSADFSDFVVGFADLSDLCASDLCASGLCSSDLCVSAFWAGFAVLLGFLSDFLSGFLSSLGAGCVCAAFASEAGAARASPVTRPIAANATMSRMAFTGTDLSAAAPLSQRLQYLFGLQD